MRRYSIALAIATSALLAACADDTTGPSTGTLRVTASTTGADYDSDGYSCGVNGSSRAIGVDETVTWDGIEAGDHTVELTGLAGNCVVDGENPRNVTVTAGQAASTTFDVSCSALTGALQMTTVTVGDTLDPDGYTVTLNDTTTEAIPINDTVVFSDLEPGNHTVEVGGVQVNCKVSGENPQTVSVPVGDTVQVSFDISCAVALFDHIAFASDRDGNLEIYVMVSDGSNPRNLSKNPARDSKPAWSPDGTQIAFSRGGYGL